MKSVIKNQEKYQNAHTAVSIITIFLYILWIFIIMHCCQP